MNNIDISLIRHLYEEQKLSVPAIAKKLGCSQWMLYKRMRKNNIAIRDQAESNRYTFEATPLSFQPKQSLNRYEVGLKQAALMLYWAEGSKRDGSCVDFANSDSEMILLFTRCLRIVYGVSETRLRIFMYCHANQPVEQLIDFWSKLTGIPTDQFTKPYIKYGAAGNHQVMKHGLVHIRYADQRLMQLIMSDIREIINPMLGLQSGQMLQTVLSSFPL